jgi:uncharacterized protein YjbI with pentapeptide repeats
MKSLRLLLLVLCFGALNSFSLAQQNNPIQYPYGGLPDPTRKTNLYEKIPLTFHNDAYFVKAQFQSIADFSGAHFQRDADFRVAQFQELANFLGTYFHGPAIFLNSRFSDKVYFTSRFDSLADFSIIHFGKDAWFQDVQFWGEASFFNVQFNSVADFPRVLFNGSADFSRTRFSALVNFVDTQFKNSTLFQEAKFEGRADFRNANFKGEVNFRDAHFHEEIDFYGTTFGKAINFERTNFSQGVDFRRSKFDFVKLIYLYGIKFPEGKLYLYWDQFKATDGLRIKLYNAPNEKVLADSTKEHYQRIETIYYLLRDNFLKQNDKASADAVMFELGWQREEIKKEFLWKVYGWIFGYGYQPWRFLLLVATIAMGFSFVWYFKYYGIVAIILNENDVGRTVFKFLGSKEGKPLNKTIGIKGIGITIKGEVFNHDGLSTYSISQLHRIWHVVFFSFAVLLGVRWKREWSDIKYNGMFGANTFLRLVTIEYVLGLCLYIAFAVLVQSSRFDYIKGLLGF